jgi:peptidyl-dipeptidase A
MRRNFPSILLSIVVLLVFFSCTQKQSEPAAQERHVVTIKSKNELLPYLDSLERTYERACLQVGMANWNSYSKEAPYDLNAAKAELGKIFSDSTARAIIDEWRGKSNSLADKPLARRLELWHRVFMGGTIYADSSIARRENALQQTITNFAFTFNGSSITRAKVSTQMRQEKKESRRHALWSVTSQLSAATAGDLLSLVKSRNERARHLGFPNYYSLTLHLNAIDEEWLLKTLDFLEEQTHELYEDFITASSKKLHIKKFGPWDFDYALREAVALPDKYFPSDSVFNAIHEFEKGIGLNVDSLPIKESVKDIPYGGLNLAIDIPRDTRFMVNPMQGHRFYAVAFHEYGHALKAVHTNVEYPILKGYEWVPGAQCSAYEEGVADMHAEFTDDSLWLTTFPAVKQKLVEKYLASRGIPGIYRLRRAMKDFFIEYEMYKNPDQNMDSLEHAMFKKYLLVDIDSTEHHQFASSIWYASYPCYFQNYIMAGMIATQLQEALSNKFGIEKCINPHLAQWMIDHLYESGEKLEWNERIRNATGKSLEPGAYLRKLGVEQSHQLTKE